MVKDYETGAGGPLVDGSRILRQNGLLMAIMDKLDSTEKADRGQKL